MTEDLLSQTPKCRFMSSSDTNVLRQDTMSTNSSQDSFVSCNSNMSVKSSLDCVIKCESDPVPPPRRRSKKKRSDSTKVLVRRHTFDVSPNRDPLLNPDLNRDTLPHNRDTLPHRTNTKQKCTIIDLDGERMPYTPAERKEKHKALPPLTFSNTGPPLPPRESPVKESPEPSPRLVRSSEVVSCAKRISPTLYGSDNKLHDTENKTHSIENKSQPVEPKKQFTSALSDLLDKHSEDSETPSPTLTPESPLSPVADDTPLSPVETTIKETSLADIHLELASPDVETMTIVPDEAPIGQTAFTPIPVTPNGTLSGRALPECSVVKEQDKVRTVARS